MKLDRLRNLVDVINIQTFTNLGQWISYSRGPKVANYPYEVEIVQNTVLNFTALSRYVFKCRHSKPKYN